MALIDELKERRDRQEKVLDEVAEAIKEREDYRLRVEQELDDLDRAIAALEPDLIDEASVALEQLETDHALPPSADDVVTDLQGDTVEEMREAFEDVFEAQAEPVEHISILTGDPAIEPESGLHETPDDEAQRAAAIELTADVEPEIQALIESGEHSYDEVAAIAYPEPQWNEPQTEGYAPVVDQPPTNPEADALAKAHDYYSPEKMAARNRSMFSIFRREKEEA
jgi:hypothetical protein